MKYIFLLLLVFVASPAWAVPAYDNVTNGVYTETSPQSFSLNTVAGSDRIALACVRLFGGAMTVDATYPKIGGSSMIAVDSQVSSGGGDTLRLYYLVAPATGTPTFELAFSAAAAEAIVTTWTGIHQSGPLGAAVKSNNSGVSTDSLSVNVSSATGELVVDCLDVSVIDSQEPGTITIGADQTERGTHSTGGVWYGKVSEQAGAATATMSWSWANLTGAAIIAVPLKPVSGGGGSTRRPIVMIVP